MQQYFVNSNYENKSYILSEDDSFHIVRVMRKNVGDMVFVAFNDTRCICKIETLDQSGVSVRPYEKVEQSTELQINISIAIPPLKNDKLEYLIQKSTELGVHEIILFDSERNIAKIKEDKFESKAKRWNKIAKEAAEQSKRGVVPNIKYMKSMKELVENHGNVDYKLVAYENESQNNSNHNLRNFFNSELKEKNVIVIFGSEGGLSEKEIDFLKDNKYKEVGLGKRILRAETAPLYFLSCLAFFVELN